MIISAGFAPTFPFPKSKALDLSKLSAKDEQARQNLSQASELRHTLLSALKTSNPSQIAAAADAYLPAAVGIWRAMEQGQTKDGRALTVGLSFTWTSFTFRKPDTFFTMYSWRFEVMMVLICRMIAAGNTAAGMLDAVQSQAQYEETAKAALQHVKLAVGLAQFISERIHPLKEVLMQDRAPEVHQDLLSSIGLFYQATGQSIACRQAQNKGMSYSLLGKLFAAAARFMAKANELLQGEGLKRDYSDIAPPIKNFAKGYSQLLKATALVYVAEASWKDKKFGLGLGILREAKVKTDEALAAGIMNGASRSLAARVEEHKENMTKLLALYEKDNATVYFEKVVSLDAPPESQEVTASHPLPYKLPGILKFDFSEGPESEASDYLRLALEALSVSAQADPSNTPAEHV